MNRYIIQKVGLAQKITFRPQFLETDIFELTGIQKVYPLVLIVITSIVFNLESYLSSKSSTVNSKCIDTVSTFVMMSSMQSLAFLKANLILSR